MPDKTKIVVVIESHEQTTIRRWRRVSSSQLLTQGEVARPEGFQPSSSVGFGRQGSSSADATERPGKRSRRRLAAWWRTVALKGVTVFAQWSRRLKLVGNKRSNKKP